MTDWITTVAATIAAAGTSAAAWAAWKSAQANERAGRDTAEDLVLATERHEAIKADDALRTTEVDAQSADWSSLLGAVHNRWRDDVATPAMRLRDREIRRRVQLVGDVVFPATQAPKDEHVSYAFLAAVEDARAALNAFLQNEPLPPAHFPKRNTLWPGDDLAAGSQVPGSGVGARRLFSSV